NESIFSGGLGVHVIWVGILMGLVSIAAQWYEINAGDSNWQTIVFTVLCFSQLWHVMAIRSDTRSLFRQGLLGNKNLLGAIAITVLLQFIIIYVPQLNGFFHTSPLTWIEMVTAVAVSSIVFWAVEAEKLIKSTRLKQQAGKSY
ncbi:MAG: cation transporting ATPase C-terminal domain-containing protein, partial [Chitinophagales bacterium]